MKLAGWLMVILLGAALPSGAAPKHATATSGHADAHASAPGPVISTDATWVGEVVIIVVGLFVAAAVIGPIYRLSLPEELQVIQSHDEPPGSSGHHGASGSVDHSAPEKHGH